MEFDTLKTALSAKRPMVVHAMSIPADDACPSLTPLLCPEIIRLINEYELSDHRAMSLTDG